jgi:hypothetical protein
VGRNEWHVMQHVTDAFNQGTCSTHIFFGRLDTGRDVAFVGERFIFAGVNLVLSEYWKRCFDTQLLVPYFPGGHGCRRR